MIDNIFYTGGQLRLDPAVSGGELRGELLSMERQLRLEHRGQREQLVGGELLQQAPVHLPGLRIGVSEI